MAAKSCRRRDRTFSRNGLREVLEAEGSADVLVPLAALLAGEEDGKR